MTVFGDDVSSVHWLPPQNVTLVCRFVPVATVTFFAIHEYWGCYHAPSKILPNTSLVQKLSRVPLLGRYLKYLLCYFSNISTITPRYLLTGNVCGR